MRGMPVNNVDISQRITAITGETVQLYYYTSGGVLTLDAGQAIGTTVVAQLAHGGIKNALGSFEATKNDTSLSFTSTALTTEADFDWPNAEAYDEKTGKARADKIVEKLYNGQYVVDYTNGIIYGKKASITSSLTATTYKIHQEITSSAGGVAEDVNVAKFGSSTVAIGQQTMAGSMPVAIASNQSAIAVDWDEIGGNAISVNAGDKDDGTQRITLANDDVSVGRLDDIINKLNGNFLTGIVPRSGLNTLFDGDGDNTAQACKASAGELHNIVAYNPNATIAWVQIFDVATAGITVGTTVPKLSIPVPALGSISVDTPTPFGTAISYACTTTATGAVDPTVGLTLNFWYK